MKVLSGVFLLAAAIGFTLSGCSDKPNPVEGIATGDLGGDALGKATVVHVEKRIPFYNEGTTPCLGEFTLNAELHLVYHFVFDKNGDLQLSRWHNNAFGSMWAGGVEYRILEHDNIKEYKGGNGATQDNVTVNWQMIGPGGITELGKVDIRHTWTPNGDVTVDVYNWEIICK